MGLFGHRRDKRRRDRAEEPDEIDTDLDFAGDDSDDLDDLDAIDELDDHGELDELDSGQAGDLFELSSGPYDEADAPDDGRSRLDLGSVRLPVPNGAQLQVEMDQKGPVRAVHVVLPVGQLTVNAYAAPRSGGLWQEVCGELAEQLRSDGAKVRSLSGEWGQELIAALGEMSLRFVGVDGSRWMLRGVVAGPPDQAEEGSAALHDLIRGTVVVRGSQPMPVRTPLLLELPPAIAAHVTNAQGDPGQ